MSRFVLDASMTMAWCFEDETSARTEAVLARLATDAAVVPSVWPLDVANVLAIAERRERVTQARVAQFLNQLDHLPIELDEETARNAFGKTFALARQWQLSAYDAAYLELAMRVGCPLASLDAPLNQVAASLGIALFEG